MLVFPSLEQCSGLRKCKSFFRLFWFFFKKKKQKKTKSGGSVTDAWRPWQSENQLAGYTIGYQKLRFTSIKGFERKKKKKKKKFVRCCCSQRDSQMRTQLSCYYYFVVFVSLIYVFLVAPQFMPTQSFQMFENYLNGHFPAVKKSSPSRSAKPRAE